MQKFKRKNKVVLAVALSVSLLCSCNSTQSPTKSPSLSETPMVTEISTVTEIPTVTEMPTLTETPSTTGVEQSIDSTEKLLENSSEEVYVDRDYFRQILSPYLAELPEGEWQKDVAFPDWKGYVDDSLAMNGMVSFRGYSGQGYIYVTRDEGITGFKMFVNGIEVDTYNSDLITGTTSRIDIGHITQNGINAIQVSKIESDNPEAKVHVRIPYPEVILPVQDSYEGPHKASIKLISDIITADIEEGFPGAQLAVVQNGQLVYEKAWGSTNAYLPDGTRNTEGAPVTTDTLFDLASVTKVFSVNYAIQKLLTDGLISLDDKVADYIGDRFYETEPDESFASDVGLEHQKEWKQALTIRDLMQHRSGYSDDPRYYNPNLDYKLPADDPENVNLLYAGNDGSPETKEATINAICRTPLRYVPGTKTVYSDINYILLGVVVETITGQDLNSWLKETFWTPMGLKNITYNPLENGFTADDCAATELNGNTRDGNVMFPGVRTDTIQGEVHDEIAYYNMGGISGHAGLFANASDLAKLASVMLTGGYGEHRFFSRNVIDLVTAPRELGNSQWGLGWYREGDDQRVWYFGTQADQNTIGHQGWTGTLVMIDPSRDLVIVYLTNKINSPVTSPEENVNEFDGGYFTSSTLGFIPQILSIGETPNWPDYTTYQLTALATDMALEAKKLIKDEYGADHPAVRNLRARVKVLREWVDSVYGAEGKDVPWANWTADDMKKALELADMLEKYIDDMSNPIQ